MSDSPEISPPVQRIALDDALNMVRSLISAGDLGKAGHLLQEIRRQRPQLAEAPLLQAELCSVAMQFPKALGFVSEAEALGGRTMASMIARAKALSGMMHYDTMIDELQAADRMEPLGVEGLLLLGDGLQRRKRFAEAIGVYDRALQIAPEHPLIWVNRATAMHTTGDISGAMEGYRHALTLDPKNVAAMNNLGAAMRAFGRTDEAIDLLRRSIETDPNSPGGWNNLGLALDEAGVNDEAAAAYRRAIELDPGFSEAYGNLIFSLGFDPRTTQQDHFAARREWCRRFADQYSHDIPAHANDRAPNRVLRVGYVSADFRHHPASYVFLPVLSGHDPAKVAVYLYAQNVREDAVSERIRSAPAVAAWRPIAALDDDAVAQQIRADNIDILVDLAGHSAGNRLRVFARKPAPIQVSGWGHATGTGLLTMDYLFADPWLVPPDLRSGIHETIIDLPAAQSYAPPIEAPAVAPVPMLAKGYPTFGSFNRLNKLSDACLDLWAELMRAVPNARLLIKDRLVASESQRRRVGQRLINGGVAPGRIELRGATEILDHLGHYNDVDVHLDPMPQCGGMTTLEALWMGVPTVSLPGQTVTSRFGASVLNSVGLPELIASDRATYLQIACNLLAAPHDLAQLRANLRTRMKNCAILDAPRYAQAVETAYRKMWRTWCAAQENR